MELALTRDTSGMPLTGTVDQLKCYKASGTNKTATVPTCEINPNGVLEFPGYLLTPSGHTPWLRSSGTLTNGDLNLIHIIVHTGSVLVPGIHI